MHYVMLVFKGLAIGVANVIPGVSGATLAIIFRVYDKLLGAINTLFTDTKNALKFLIPLGFGMGIGILALGSMLDFFFYRFSLQASAFIAGLMAGSLPFIHHMATSKDGKRPKYYIIATCAAAIIIAIVFFAPTAQVYAEDGISAMLIFRLFVGGFLGAAAMVIPGMSGSVILILLGVFPTVIHTISLIREYLMSPLDFSLLPPIILVVAPVGIGLVAGIFATSKFVAFLLDKHKSVTYAAVMGLVFGTVFAIFNNDSAYQSYTGLTAFVVLSAIAIFAFGVFTSLLLGKKEA